MLRPIPAILPCPTSADGHRGPVRRLKTLRRPPIYPNGAQAISPVAPSPPFPCSHAVHRWIRAKAPPVNQVDVSVDGALRSIHSPSSSTRYCPSRWRGYFSPGRGHAASPSKSTQLRNSRQGMHPHPGRWLPGLQASRPPGLQLHLQLLLTLAIPLFVAAAVGSRCPSRVSRPQCSSPVSIPTPS